VVAGALDQVAYKAERIKRAPARGKFVIQDTRYKPWVSERDLQLM